MKKLLVFLVLASIFSSCWAISQKNTIPMPEERLVVEVHYPIEGFDTNISAKPFGIYVSPESSSIQPEKFRGYHVGVDIEVAQNTEDVWVYAISNGEVLSVQTVNGYGGVIQVLYETGYGNYTALYGHLNVNSSLVSVGDSVFAGDPLALLGDPYSFETDGERKHLHFSLKPGLDLDLRGYVQTEEELKEWADPVEFKGY